MSRHTVEVNGVIIGEGIPKICVPIIEHSETEIIAAAVSFGDKPFDLVEWRADYFTPGENAEADENVLHALRQVFGSIPLLFTFRTKAEGGEMDISPAEYENLLLETADSGAADLIDVELRMAKQCGPDLVGRIHERGGRVVLSCHDFQKTPTPEEMIRILREMQDLDGDILKLAVMPQNRQDVLNLLEATGTMKERYADRPLITMAMGAQGVVSRISGEIFGSDVTFGCIGEPSAPGQMDVSDLDDVLIKLHRSLG